MPSGSGKWFGAMMNWGPAAIVTIDLVLGSKSGTLRSHVGTFMLLANACCVASSNFSDIHMLIYVSFRHGSTVAVNVVPVVFADLSPAGGSGVVYSPTGKSSRTADAQ